MFEMAGTLVRQTCVVHPSSYGYSGTLRIDPDYGSTRLRAPWVKSRQDRLDDLVMATWKRQKA